MTTAAPTRAQTLQLEFDDNALLPMLFGEHDRYLARIEQRLGVQLHSRGNRVRVSGPAAQATMARDVLRMLYARLEAGQGVGAHEVDAAIRHAETGDGESFADDAMTIRTRKRHVAPRSPNQTRYLAALREHALVFGIGPAGTGKTYLAVAMAVQMLSTGKVDRIVLSRPAVEAGERLGFLPGDLKEKIDPYLRPLYDALFDMLPGDQVIRRIGDGEIEIAPLAFMRGRTLSNAFVILDEAQNATPMQMKMFLTRLGENSRMVVTGDPSQVDLPGGIRSGLDQALEILKDVPGLAFVHFDAGDVVRHPLVGEIVRAYDRHEPPRHPRTEAKPRREQP